MNKYQKFLFILLLQGCTILNNFDDYTYIKNDSGIGDSSITDTFIALDSNLSDSSIIDVNNFRFPIVTFLSLGKEIRRETSICLSCNTNNDCVDGEVCNTFYNICSIPCSDIEICNSENNFTCSGVYCYFHNGCDIWIENNY